MSRTYTQKELFDYCKANPLQAKVHVGDLPNMNGDDYIFIDYIDERLISHDNEGIYKTTVQFSVYVKNFVNRKILVDYIKPLSQFSILFESSNEGNYFVAQMTTELFIQ